MKKQTYESAIKKLEEIIDTLEGGNIPLEKSMELFEEGTKLTAFCSKCLNEAEQKITQLSSLEEKEND